MPWNYDPTDLDVTTASGRLNVVRLTVGDTDPTDEQVQDEEINFALAQNSNKVYRTAAFIAEVILAKYARLVTTEVDEQMLVHYTDLRDNYRNLVATLKDKASIEGASLGVGGKTYDSTFERGQFDNKRSVDLCDQTTW